MSRSQFWFHVTPMAFDWSYQLLKSHGISLSSKERNKTVFCTVCSVCLGFCLDGLVCLGGLVCLVLVS